VKEIMNLLHTMGHMAHEDLTGNSQHLKANSVHSTSYIVAGAGFPC
jgi:hypothetical protein